MSAPEIRLDSRVIVITGAGQGLGRAYAVAAAQAGARVVVNDLDASGADQTTALIRQAGGQAVAHIGAVERPETAPELIELAHAEFSAFDAVILNAGVMHVTPAVEVTPAQIRQAVEINVLGTMFCGVPALRALTEQGHGSVVLVTSGARFGMTDLSTYAATKGAVASLTWSWASEAAGHGVRVNAISPFAQTAMFALNPAVSNGPTPESVAPVAVYLLSDQHELNGEVVRFDGTSLSIYVHQGSTMTEVITQPSWSAAEIAEAVRKLTPS